MHVDKLPSLLQLDRQRNEELLRAVMELALDPAPIGRGGQHEPLPRSAQLLNLPAIYIPHDGSALDDTDQLGNIDGLGEIVVEPDIQETLAVPSHRLRGHRDHGDRVGSLIFAELSERFDAVD